MKIFVTGSAGFIGFHVAKRLLVDGHTVVGIDNFSPYYDVALKNARHTELQRYAAYTLYNIDIEDRDQFSARWREHDPQIVIHLAAQAGVRHSLQEPALYVNTNILGTLHVLE